MKHGLTIRGDSLYCPLSLSLDSYRNCLVDCAHCYLRRLNHVWGKELNPINPVDLHRKLQNGLNAKSPRSGLAHALKQKKTIRFGNKADPFQPIERDMKVSEQVLEILVMLKWSTVIQTMVTEVMMDYEDLLIKGKNIFIIQPIISPGYEKDWEILEKQRTTPPADRLCHVVHLRKAGLSVGVNGEPFIPGYHTLEDFENMLKILKSFKINVYNTYNFHLNDFVAKRMINIGIDMVKVWEENQDDKWKKTQQQLIDLAKKYNIILGCPDFVNTGDYKQSANTCCGINVPNPTTFNTHTWKSLLQKNTPVDTILEKTYDGIGDIKEGEKILTGTSSKFYTMSDIDKGSLW